MGPMDDVRTQPEDAVPGVRWIEDAATFKAMADPIRLAILRRMMAPAPEQELRNWSVKELAAELDQPQTRLYRHVKQLEESGLIRVAETRLVSGIVEQRYVAAQASLEISRDFIEHATTRDETADLFAAGIDAYRHDLLAAVRSGRIDLKAEKVPGAAYSRPLLMFGDIRLSPARASEFRDRLAEVLDEFVGSHGQAQHYTGADGVELGVLVGCYRQSGEQPSAATVLEPSAAEVRED
jgi:DNA-binding transcriptional ArsR family regulator